MEVVRRMFEAPRQTRTAAVAASDAGFGLAALGEIDFRRIGSTLWQGRTTILASIAVGLLLALLFILMAPRQFTATTQILIDPTDLHAVGADTNPINQASDAAVLQVESQVRVLTSDSVMRRVVTAEGLANDPEFAGVASPQRALMDELLASLGLKSGPIVTDKTLAALNEIKRHVQVRRAERTYVVDVSVTSRDPEKAARLANAVAQAYLAEQTVVRADAARQVSQSLSARLKDLKDQVRQAEDRVESYKASHNIVGAGGQLVSEQQLADMNNQLGAARARIAAAKARLDQIEAVQRGKGDVGAFPEALQSQTITALRSQYAEIVRRETEQMATLGGRHPAVIEIQAQAERIRRMIDDEVNRIALSARGDYDAAKADEQTLANNLEALKHTTIGTNEAMVGLRELEREAQARRSIYESFLVRARETGEQEQLDTKNIRIISKANLPMRRSSPPPNMFVALAGLFMGVTAGIGIVMIRAQSETGESDPATSIPVLAVLPDVDISFGLNTVEDPKSRYAAEIEKVYRVVRQSPTRHDSPSILVIAADDRDDTAAVALTLAAMAAATKRVLLIDADLQRRTLSAIDADQSEAGLVDVAVGRRELSDVIVRDRETNINLASFISQSSRRARRIKDEDVRHAFDQTRLFDMVIVAAIDFAHEPTTRFFAGVVDHIILVARADERQQRTMAQLTARLGVDARKIRGTVLTGVEAA